MAESELIIGLGGVGGRCIRKIREISISRREESTPLDTQVEYLYIDSNNDILRVGWETPEGADISLDLGDIVELRGHNSHLSIKELSQARNIAPWIGDLVGEYGKMIDKEAEDAGAMLSCLAGTGQLRRFGRALFASNIRIIHNSLTNKLAKLAENSVRVSIFCSLGGGTGSGAMIDTITLVNEIGARLGIRTEVYVYAFAAGPAGAKCNVGTFYENQYAALRDLNALIVGKYTPHLPTGEETRFRSPSSPVTQVYLFSDIAACCPDIDEQIAQAASACIDSRIACQVNSKALKTFTLEDWIDSFPGEKDGNDELMQSYRFATVGSYSWSLASFLDEVPGDALVDRKHELIQGIRRFTSSLGSGCIDLHLTGGLTEPDTPPLTTVCLGLPEFKTCPELRSWLESAITANIPTRCLPNYGSIFSHTICTDNEIRLLYIQYWFPARFASAVEFSYKQYLKTSRNPERASVIYFSNIDDDDNGLDSRNRPALYPETPQDPPRDTEE